MEYNMIIFMLALSCLVCTSISQGANDVCVKFNNISDCEATSNLWAVGTPELTVTHRYPTTSSLTIFLTYYFAPANSAAVAICTYRFNSDGSCTKSGVSTNCTSCENHISSQGYAESTVTISDMDTDKNRSTLSYALGTPVPLLQFLLTECQGTFGDATSVNPLPDPCGYGCTTKFKCINDTNVDSSSSRSCTAKAQWEPPPSCIPETTTEDIPISTTVETIQDNSNTETTTSDISTNFISTTNPSVGIPTTEPGSEKSSARKQEQSAHSMTGLAAGAGATCSGMQVYSRHFESDGNIPKEHKERINMLLLAFVACMCVLGISLGLLYGLADNMAAFISGTTVGALALLGLVVLAVLHGRAIKMNKQIKSKKGERTTDHDGL